MFSIKQWFNRPGSGTALDAPDEASRTHLNAESLRDLEQRLSGYTDARVASVSASGGTLVIHEGDPVPDPAAYPAGTLLITLPAGP